MSATARTWLRATCAAAMLALLPAAGLASAAAADDVTVVVDIPDAGDELRVTDAQLRWGLNAESGSGAFFGGCNFLSAGVAGDAGSARVWTGADASGSSALFRTSDGEVRIEKPDADGGWQPLTWDGRCQDATGRTVTSTAGDMGTGVTAVIDGGQGVVDLQQGTARIQWRGSVTVVFYGGLTYWWLTDPLLVVEPDGTGTLTATLGGFGASMDDLTHWEPLTPVADVEIATLTGIELGERGFLTVPQFEGVTITTPDSVQPQRRELAGWGSFPQEFVDVQLRTGQGAYWYTSGGIRDSAKPATTVWVSYDAATPQQAVPPTPSVPRTPTTATPGTTGTSGSGAAAGGATPAATAPLQATPTLDGTVSLMPTVPTWLTPGLIPAATPTRGSGDLLAVGLASLLTLSSVALVGFRGGWLVLPFTRT